ncbi:MAG: helix-turn-helix domain-containing protein, partial [Gammaproteobacteria bacterium]|nr:helix-turn-helix domain-containing protein [Gammaproteobacteria bacterium]
MGTTRIRIDPDDPSTFPKGRIDPAKVDATTEADIARQAREDDADAMQDMARYTRRIRRRLGLSQTELARRIDVSPETIRNWEQGKRGPTGAARAVQRVRD